MWFELDFDLIWWNLMRFMLPKISFKEKLQARIIIHDTFLNNNSSF